MLLLLLLLLLLPKPGDSPSALLWITRQLATTKKR
jgi:hypothetical protein